MLLQQLKKALEPIVELSRAETIVDVLGTEVHLRLLTPDEELQCQQEAQQFIADFSEEDEVEDLSRTKAIRFLDGFRLSILSRAIVQINDLDLRGIDYLETGEELANGVKVKVLKTQAVRDILLQFPRQIQVLLMQKFHLLTESISVVVEENLEGDFSEDDAQIKEMEEELERRKVASRNKEEAERESDVRKLMRTTANQTESFVNERINTAQDIENKSKEAFNKATEQPSAAETSSVEEVAEEVVEEKVVQVEPTQRTRTPITPTHATPPSVGAHPPPSRTASESQESEKKEPPKESNIYQEQEFPNRDVQPMGMQNGLEVYRLPTQELGGTENTTTTNTNTTSRNPRFRPPQK